MEAATGARRRSASSAWRAALGLARRRLDLWLPAGVAALAAATLAYGWIARATGVRLGAGLAPLLADWRPLLRPSALPAIVLLAGGVAAAPRLRSGRVRPWQFALAALGLGLALRLALGMARGGADGLYAVYELETTKLPASICRRCRHSSSGHASSSTPSRRSAPRCRCTRSDIRRGCSSRCTGSASTTRRAWRRSR